MIAAQTIFKIAAGLYCLGLGGDFISGRRNYVVWLFLLPALFCNAAAVALRYWTAWPMLPMYLGSMALPLSLGILILFFANKRQGDDEGLMVRRSIFALTVITAAAAACFPKDFYLPFIKSQTMLAHFFLLFGIMGKACFLVGAARALACLLKKGRSGEGNRWTVWGFSFWTLSMFSGELWSFLGWGTPVVWDDPAITTTMATWFFYICLIHLHLTGSWTSRGRNIYTAAGGLVILIFNFIPDLGPFRWPL